MHISPPRASYHAGDPERRLIYAYEDEWNAGQQLRHAFRAADKMDWDYLVSLIPDGGRGRFWKAVIAEARSALGVDGEAPT